jgi:hypothetical protein
MYLSPRTNWQRSLDFEIGDKVLATPATVHRPICGTVQVREDDFTLVLQTLDGLQIAVDSEDCQRVA